MCKRQKGGTVFNVYVCARGRFLCSDSQCGVCTFYFAVYQLTLFVQLCAMYVSMYKYLLHLLIYNNVHCLGSMATFKGLSACKFYMRACPCNSSSFYIIMRTSLGYVLHSAGRVCMHELFFACYIVWQQNLKVFSLETFPFNYSPSEFVNSLLSPFIISSLKVLHLGMVVMTGLCICSAV